MKLIVTEQPDDLQREAIRALWNREYPESILLPAPEDFDRYLEPLGCPLHLLLWERRKRLAGWLFLFERAGSPWFAMIVSREMQGKGYGRRLLLEAQSRRSALHGWAIDSPQYTRKDGSPYPVPLPFYYKLGFVSEPGCRLEQPFSAVKITWHKASEAGGQ